MPENSPQLRTKPRASGIGGCSREMAYMMLNVDKTNPMRGEGRLTTEQGRVMEDVTVRLFERATGGEYVVANRQVELPEDFELTGHPDGQIVRREDAAWDSTCAECGGEIDDLEHKLRDHHYRPVGWVAPLGSTVNGRVIGFEHKHLGRYGYESIAKSDFLQAEPGYVAQFCAYGAALGWNDVYIVVMSQDSSSVKSDANTNLSSKKPAIRWANDPLFNPKMTVVEYDLADFVNLQKRIRMRAAMFTKLLFEDGVEAKDIVREPDPEALTHKNYTWDYQADKVIMTLGPEFPCSYCEWYDRCVEDGQGRRVIPEVQ